MMHSKQSIALFLILLGTLASVGIVHGVWTERWRNEDVTAELEDVRRLPLSAGRWDGKELEQGAAIEAIPELKKNLVRRYVNRFDGTSADVLLSRGRPGPTVMMHTPPECYPAAGFAMIGSAKRYLSQSDDLKAPDEFWVATFKKTSDLFPSTVRVYWGWSANGRFQAPDSPRLTFASYQAIYKMYVVHTIADERVELEGSPVHELVKELTMASRRTIFSTSP